MMVCSDYVCCICGLLVGMTVSSGISCHLLSKRLGYYQESFSLYKIMYTFATKVIANMMSYHTILIPLSPLDLKNNSINPEEFNDIVNST